MECCKQMINVGKNPSINKSNGDCEADYSGGDGGPYLIRFMQEMMKMRAMVMRLSSLIAMILMTPHVPLDDQWHNNIFHTTCTVKIKACMCLWQKF